MRHNLYIPEPVKAAISHHIQEATRRSVEEFQSAAEDEDVMTGHFGACLQIGPQSVEVQQAEIRGEWKWSIRYRKFRGRGPSATEKVLGADGIIELTLDRGSRVDVKSLLFQAKMVDQGGRHLFEQCIKLSTWREAATIIEYSPKGFNALSIDDVVAARGQLGGTKRTPLAQLLGERFVQCEIGDNDLRYDANARRLIWRTMAGEGRATRSEIVATDFAIGHRVGIRVQSPKLGSGVPGIDRIIEPHEIHLFRMGANDEEILGISSSDSDQVLKDSRKRLALAYHPDRAMGFDQLLRDLMNRRTQETNDAFARIKNERRDSRRR